MTTIEKTFTAITYSMEHEGSTYLVNESFDENGEPDFNIAITCSNMGHGVLCCDIVCDSDKYNRLRKVFYDAIEDDNKNYLIGTYTVSGAPGKATAYRFVAQRDQTILAVEYVDFSIEHEDEIEETLEIVGENDWTPHVFSESRYEECLNQVAEYLKTTDEPIKAHGVLPENMPLWAKDLIE